LSEPLPLLTLETQCPGCATVLVVRRTWLGRSLRCGHCGLTYPVTGPPWEVPQSKDGEPVAARLRQFLSELSAISRAPDRFSLAQELSALESLLSFLASADGRTAANVWAVRMWCAYSGDSTDYAPDALNDLYEDLGSAGLDAAEERGGTTPAQLLERLRELKRSLGSAESS
jgi:hypothetical protein